MTNPSRSCRRLVLVFTAACLLTTAAVAHPGSGIVADRQGQIYFVDTGSGIYKIDAQLALTRVPGPAFHWMALDADDRFAKTTLPKGSGWEITTSHAHPTLALASDFPIVIGRDGNLYYPSLGPEDRLQILRVTPSGQSSALISLPATTSSGPLHWLNGLAAGPDNSLYYTENNAIRKVSAQGEISTIVTDVVLDNCASLPGAEPGGGPYLRGLDVDTDGTVYVAASGCGRVLKVTPDGKFTKLLQLETPWTPTGVVRFGGDLYVLEYLLTASDDRREWLPRIRKISTDGKSAIIASIDKR